MKLVVQVAPLNLKLRLADIYKVLGVVTHYIAHSYDMGKLVLYNQAVDRNLLLAESICVQGIHQIGGVSALAQIKLHVHFVCGKVINLSNLEAPLLCRSVYALNHLLGVHPERQLLYYYLLRVCGIQLGPDGYTSQAVLIVGHVHYSPTREVRIQPEILTLDCSYLGVYDLQCIVRQNFRTHAYGNTFRALYQNHGDFCREDHRLLAPAIIGLNILSYLRVIENLFCKRKQATLNISGSCRPISCHVVSVVTLLINEKITVSQVDQSRIDGGVSMRMIVHGGAHHVRNLVEPSVIHLYESVQYSPLYRLKSVLNIRNSSVLNDV